MDLPYIMNNYSIATGEFGAVFLRDNPTLVPYIAILAFITITGTAGNNLIIISIMRTKTLRTSSNILIVNLAVADLCVSSLINPFSLVGVLAGERWFAKRFWLCEAIANICLTSCFCSLLTIGTISLNRYISICHNQYYSRIFTRTHTIIMAFILWVASFLLGVSNFFGWGDHVFDGKGLGCVWDRTADHSYAIFFSCTAVGLPLFMICTCYVSIFKHVRNSKRKIAAMSKAIGGKAIGGKVIGGKVIGGKNLMKERAESIQLARSLFIIFVVFLICWTPYAFVVAVDIKDEYPTFIHLFTMLFAHANSSFNCIVYGTTNKAFRTAFYNVLCCRRANTPLGNPKTIPFSKTTETELVLDTTN